MLVSFLGGKLVIDLMDSLRSLNTIHDWHLQVHQNEMEVPMTTLLANILGVALETMQAVHTTFDSDVEHALQL